MGFTDFLGGNLDEDDGLVIAAVVFIGLCGCMCSTYYLSSLCGVYIPRRLRVIPPADIEAQLLERVI